VLEGPKALLVYPEFPPSYWGFRYALEFAGKRAAMPPLGLLTVAALFPDRYRLRVVDMNVAELTDADLDWADLVLTSTMVVQQQSLREVIARANRRGRPVAVGGPHPTTFAADISGADHYLLDEVEESFPRFLADWEAGRAGRVYRPARKPPITSTPIPRFDLLDLGAYASMALQFSRGCPFDCEFCDITKLFGRVPRTKSNEQVLAELDRLYELGWRGAVFLVDDNFIGNKKEALRLLPALATWQRERGYPFDFYTEASVNLAKLDPLLDAMVEAGFWMTFLGIESPNPVALKRTKKTQNTDRGDDDFLLHAVRKIQEKGLEVSGGFILGLDGDGLEVFDAQVAFIQEAGIPMAMVGLLTAIRGTDLYDRLEREGRLLAESSGNNVEIALNFRPELERGVLVDGYRRVLATLYDAGLKTYFERCWTLLSRLGDRPRARRRIGRVELLAFLRSLRLQLFSRQGPAYLKFLVRTLVHRPALFDDAVRLAIKGLHFRRFTVQTLAAHEFREAARTGYERVEELADLAAASPGGPLAALRRQAAAARRQLRRLHGRLRPEFRSTLLPDRASFEAAIQACVREVSSLELVKRWTPLAQRWFARSSLRDALTSEGYEPAVRRWDGSGEPTVALAPVVEHGRMRRALELFFRELGVRVVTTAEQLAQLGHERLERLQRANSPAERLRAYLREVGHRIDALVVPSDADVGSAQKRVEVLAVRATGAAPSLPHLVCVRLERGRRRLRESLIELGIALTGDAGRAEAAFERAFALI
jgi:radical SAM superfamily enzyme YgiQ (UPF0313 family)